MTTISEIEYPLSLCVQLMYYASLGANGKTDNMRASEIKEGISLFFTEDQIQKAQDILTGKDMDYDN